MPLACIWTVPCTQTGKWAWDVSKCVCLLGPKTSFRQVNKGYFTCPDVKCACPNKSRVKSTWTYLHAEAGYNDSYCKRLGHRKIINYPVQNKTK